MPAKPSDDQRHSAGSPAANWRESWTFYAFDARRQIGFVVRLGLAPNLGSASVTIGVTREGRPLYHRHMDELPVPGGDVLSGMSSAGLTFRCLSLQRGRFLLSFADPAAQLSFDLDWAGLHEAAESVSLHAPDEDADDLGSVQIEQFGRVAGRLTSRGQTVDVVGTGPRDHSVGVRDADSRTLYDAVWVLLDDGRAFGFRQERRASGFIQSPWTWNGEKILPLEGMRLERILDEEHRPVSMTVHASDADRNRYLLSGDRRACFSCFRDDSVFHTGFFDITLDDGTRGHGVGEYGYRMGEDR